MGTTCCLREFIMARATTAPGKRNRESIFLHSESLPPKRHGLGGELGEFGKQLGKMVEETVVAILSHSDQLGTGIADDKKILG